VVFLSLMIGLHEPLSTAPLTCIDPPEVTVWSGQILTAEVSNWDKCFALCLFVDICVGSVLFVDVCLGSLA
jgi:hypothetical protein